MNLTRGTPITMTDGWSGRVTSIDGDTIVCQQDGIPQNDRLNGCRSVHRRLVTVAAKAATAAWPAKSAATPAPAAKPAIDLNQVRRDREREKIRASWETATTL